MKQILPIAAWLAVLPVSTTYIMETIMTDTSDMFKQGMDQLTAMTQNWMKAANRNTTASPSGESMQKLTSLGSDLQALYAEAYQRHLDPFLNGNQKIAEQFSALTRSRDPQDFADFQLEMLGLVMEGASVRAEVWGELADKVGHRYAEFVREMAANMKSTPGESQKPQGHQATARTGATAPARGTTAKAGR